MLAYACALDAGWEQLRWTGPMLTSSTKQGYEKVLHEAFQTMEGVSLHSNL